MPSSARAPRCFLTTAPSAEADRLADRAVEIFQPASPERLTRADGVEILEGLARFVQLLAAWDAEARQPPAAAEPDPLEVPSDCPPEPSERGPGRRPRRAQRAPSPEYLS